MGQLPVIIEGLHILVNARAPGMGQFVDKGTPVVIALDAHNNLAWLY